MGEEVETVKEERGTRVEENKGRGKGTRMRVCGGGGGKREREKIKASRKIVTDREVKR